MGWSPQRLPPLWSWRGRLGWPCPQPEASTPSQPCQQRIPVRVCRSPRVHPPPFQNFKLAGAAGEAHAGAGSWHAVRRAGVLCSLPCTHLPRPALNTQARTRPGRRHALSQQPSPPPLQSRAAKCSLLGHAEVVRLHLVPARPGNGDGPASTAVGVSLANLPALLKPLLLQAVEQRCPAGQGERAGTGWSAGQTLLRSGGSSTAMSAPFNRESGSWEWPHIHHPNLLTLFGLLGHVKVRHWSSPPESSAAGHTSDASQSTGRGTTLHK